MHYIFGPFQTIGSQVQVKIVKNKLAPPFKTVLFELEFGKGISRASELIELGLKHKFITKASSYYTYNGQGFRGKDALKVFLTQNGNAEAELMMKLREKLIEGEKEKESETENTDGEAADEIVSPESTDEEPVSAAEA